MDTEDLAATMVAQCIADGQSARTVVADTEADALREALRRAAREENIRVRTARIDTVVAIARLDADLWNEDTATMRAKLSPPA